MGKSEDIAVFGSGCFWCTEAIFQMLRGVSEVTPGYAGGTTESPSYHDLHDKDTGHAEVIRVKFDSSVIPYRDLLDVFWHTHNPTTLNRQGADVGSEYRSVILYMSEEQRKTAEELKEELQKSEFNGKVITEIKPLEKFYEAEGYHKNYYKKNTGAPYCELVISPKLKHLREKYAEKLKE